MSETSEKKERREERRKERRKRNFWGLIIIALIIFAIIKYNGYQATINTYTSQGNPDGNFKLLSRSATMKDISVSSDLDLLSFGVKYTITPKKDIDDLKVTVILLDGNKHVIKLIEKYIGDTKSFQEINFSLSLSDYEISNMFVIEYESISITGGTVSYFS